MQPGRVPKAQRGGGRNSESSVPPPTEPGVLRPAIIKSESSRGRCWAGGRWKDYFKKSLENLFEEKMDLLPPPAGPEIPPPAVTLSVPHPEVTVGVASELTHLPPKTDPPAGKRFPHSDCSPEAPAAGVEPVAFQEESPPGTWLLMAASRRGSLLLCSKRVWQEPTAERSDPIVPCLFLRRQILDATFPDRRGPRSGDARRPLSILRRGSPRRLLAAEAPRRDR